MRVGGLAIDVERRAGRATIRCSGVLDVSTCRDLDTAVQDVLDAGLACLELDGSEISLLTAAGIKCLVRTQLACRNRGVDLDMKLSPEARKVLDVVGLWWLGVVADGISVEIALERALRTYGSRGFDGFAGEREERRS